MPIDWTRMRWKFTDSIKRQNVVLCLEEKRREHWKKNEEKNGRNAHPRDLTECHHPFSQFRLSETFFSLSSVSTAIAVTLYTQPITWYIYLLLWPFKRTRKKTLALHIWVWVTVCRYTWASFTIISRLLFCLSLFLKSWCFVLRTS